MYQQNVSWAYFPLNFLPTLCPGMLPTIGGSPEKALAYLIPAGGREDESWQVGFLTSLKTHRPRSVTYICKGHEQRLSVILYEPGSSWDHQVQAAQSQAKPIYVSLGTSAAPLTAPLGAPAPTRATTPGAQGVQWGAGTGDEGAGPSNWRATEESALGGGASNE